MHANVGWHFAFNSQNFKKGNTKNHEIHIGVTVANQS